MVALALLLIPLAFLLSLALTLIVRTVSHRVGALDSVGVAGQQKVRRKVPNTGGIAIVATFALTLLLGLLAFRFLGDAIWHSIAGSLLSDPETLTRHIPGIRAQTPLAFQLLACVLLLHVLGLIDDRKPLGPFLKLVVMILPALWITSTHPGGTGDTRLLTLLDTHVGGAWLSIAITVLWFLVVTNAMNFMDNMDGLSAGVGAIGASCLLAVALMHGQWFIAACLALLIGALAGFLAFNFPWRLKPDGSGGASIFMGDGGSVVLGFLLAFLTTRMTYVTNADAGNWSMTLMLPHGSDDHQMYVQGHPLGPPWYVVLTPLLILAVPLYDFVSVVLLRLSQGRSPFVGDQQHLSHRTVRRGVNKRTAVLVIYAFAAATGLSAIPLPTLEPWQAMLVGGQALVLLVGLGLFEWSALRTRDVEELSPREGSS